MAAQEPKAGGPNHVLIAGGGVAALEALLALRRLAGDSVKITLLAPNDHLIYKPLTVTEPFFTREHMHHYSLQEMTDDIGAELVHDALVEVIPDSHKVHCESGAELSYDTLLIAVGAKQEPASEHGITFGEHDAMDAVAGVVADLEQGYGTSAVFVAPPDCGWTLPLYELVLLTAQQVHGMGVEDFSLTLVTHEETPLAVFGPAISADVAQLLQDSNVEFIGPTRATIERGEVRLQPQDRHIEARRIIVLPRIVARHIPGIPSDPNGFIPVDEFGVVQGVKDIYAAGDATAFPIKQGGLATQQADAVASAIAAKTGAMSKAAPFKPVLRGQLLAGDSKHFMRHQISGGGGEGETDSNALWWPPTKIAGRYLTPYLFDIDERELMESGQPGYVPIEVRLEEWHKRFGELSHDHDVDIFFGGKDTLRRKRP